MRPSDRAARSACPVHRSMLMGCFYAETLLNFVEWQVHTVDAQRGTVREIARLAFFRVKVLHACM